MKTMLVVLLLLVLGSVQAQSYGHKAEEYLVASPRHNQFLQSFEKFGVLLEGVKSHEKIGVYAAQKHSLQHVPQVRRVWVEMRDGVKLSTIVVNPYPYDKKKSATIATSPYGPLSDQIADLFTALDDTVAIIQDQRGTFLSEGNFSFWRHDSMDQYDTMDWIVKQPFSNGKIFQFGISADGMGAFSSVYKPHKALRGQFLMITSSDGHKTAYPGGSFRMGLIGDWMIIMSTMTHGYSLTHTLPEVLSNEGLDNYYDTVEGKNHYKNCKWPSVMYTAWFDIFQGLQLEGFEAYRTQSHHSVREKHRIVIGPLGHCVLSVATDNPKELVNEGKGWINAFGLASEMMKEQDDGYFHKRLDRYNFWVQGPLNRDGNHHTVGNFWTSLPEFPKPTMKRLYFSGANQLVERVEDITPEVYTYEYDPHKPVVTRGGNNMIIANLPEVGCGPQDQSHIEKRDDVVVFTTQVPLNESLVITGKLTAVVYVSSDVRDTDFHVAVTDVYPDKYKRSNLVRNGLQRMKWRSSLSTATLMNRGEVYRVEIDLWQTSYVFNPGHRIRVTVTSSNAPFVLPNDNTARPLIDSVEDIVNQITGKHNHVRKPKQAVVATNNIHADRHTHVSYVELPVVSLHDLPENKHFV